MFLIKMSPIEMSPIKMSSIKMFSIEMSQSKCLNRNVSIEMSQFIGRHRGVASQRGCRITGCLKKKIIILNAH
jgi:hypothetical protein